MASILPGYEYDIFISYRQNDNRSGWVTEFVKALQEELAATIKETVSVYFDSNPHDGLLETHNVDKSLEGKLKCLIFIPIISQTYCDPKSFAWQHEFCAFNKLAKEDQFGRDIKLSKGNVSSRILPVKVHDLDVEDKSTIENEIGGALRAIEFIYKEPGVNRPLKTSDSKQDNLNKTDYSNQVNKVANAIRDLITSMEHPLSIKASPISYSDTGFMRTSRRKKVATWAAGLLFLTLIAWASFHYLYEPPNLRADNASIAVIPFLNATGDDSKEYIGIGIANEVSTQLGLTRKFAFVSSLQATMEYLQSNTKPKTIAGELNVDFILTGLYQTDGQDILVTAELTDASGKVIWPLRHRARYANIFDLQENIAQQVMNRFSISQESAISSTTQNPAANFHYVMGMQTLLSSSRRNALPHFIKAAELDSGFLSAYVKIIEAWSEIYWGSRKDSIKRLVENYMNYVERKFPESWEKKRARGSYQYFVLQDWDKAERTFLDVLAENPEAETLLGAIYKRRLRLNDALRVNVKILRQTPNFAMYWTETSILLKEMGDLKRGVIAASRAYELDTTRVGRLFDFQSLPESLPPSFKIRYHRGMRVDSLLRKRSFKAALGYLNNISLDTTIAANFINMNKAICYAGLGQEDQVQYYAKQINGGTYWDSQHRLGFLCAEREYDSLLARMYPVNDREFDRLWAMQATRDKLRYYILCGDFENTNATLQKLNRNFPEIGDYSYLDVTVYDRIKKEYPPFLETIKNLKYPTTKPDPMDLELFRQ